MSRFSVKRPHMVIVAVVIVIVLGVVAFTKLSTDLLPSMELPYAIVLTTYQGASPESVEMVVTDPVESAMATVSNIKNISSTSSENLSMVVMEFNNSANMDSVTIEIRESLDMIESYWPEEVGSPIIMKLNPDMLPVMMASVSGEGKDITEITELYNNYISQDIKGLEGVASVTATGLVESSIQVVIDDDRVQEVNDRLIKKIEEKFDDAQEEIDDGRKEIEDGKNQLEDGKNQAASAFGEAQSQITSGSTQMANGMAQLAIQEAALNEQEQNLLNAEKQLQEAIGKVDELKKAKAEAEAGKAAAEQALAELQNSKAAIEAAIAAVPGCEGLTPAEAKPVIEGQIATLQGMIDALNAQIETTREAGGDTTALEAQLKTLTETMTQMTQLLTGIDNYAQIEAGIAQTEAGIAQADTAIKQIDDGLTQIEAQLGDVEAAKAQIKSGKEGIAAGKAAIATAKAQLEAGQASLGSGSAQVVSQEFLTGIELSVAQAQLAVGEMNLNQAEEQFKETKKQTLDSTDLTTVITPAMVKGILTAENFSMPAGYITEAGKEYLVRIGDKVTDYEQLENLVIMDLSSQDLGQIYLKDIADIAIVDNSKEVYARMNGQPGVLISVEKQNGYSTADVAKTVRNYMSSDKLASYGVEIKALMDQGIYIDLVINSVLNNLLLGAVLAIIVLLVFLKDLRPTLVVAVSIPVSVVFAIVLMYFSGVTLNIISLSGLALGVGMLVDNSIVVIENIYRMRNLGVSVRKAAIDGAKQVAGAIVASTLTTVCIWAPIIFVEGITKQIFTDLVLTIGYSLLASLVVALTVVPMMASRVLKNSEEKKSRVLDRILHVYGKSLGWALKHKIVVILLVLILLGGSIAGVLGRGYEFMGSTDSEQISVNVKMDDETTFDEATAMADTIMDRVMAVEGVKDTGAMLGSSLSMISSMGNTDTSSISFYIILSEDREKTSDEIALEIMDVTKDLDCEVSASGSTMDMSAMGGSGVSVQIKGDDLDKLRAIADDYADILKNIEGTVEVSNGQEKPSSDLTISVDKKKAMAYNLTVAQVFQQINTLIAAPTASTSLNTDEASYDVFVSDAHDKAMNREDIRNLVLSGTDGDQKPVDVKLSEIADIQDTLGLSSIRHSDQRRTLTVSCGVDAAHNATLITEEFKEKIDAIELPEGYSVKFSGEYETVMESFRQIAELLILGILIMYLIMVAQFQSFKSPFIVLFTIPLAFTGGFLGLFFTGNKLSVIAFIGFVMLCGIIVNNGIVFVDYVNQLRAEGKEKRDALLETGRTRFRPIMMTALTTIFAMLTMALGLGSGTDMVQPMAIVTVGGLLYGTLLTLYFVPVIYDLFNRKEMKVYSDDE